jgi:uncharacterized protein
MASPEAPLIAASTIAWWGAGLGTLFGYFANRTNFCTMGAVADIVNMQMWTRMRMWLFALGVAILATGAMQLTGTIDISKTIYTAPKLVWLSHLVGGLLFGVGMTLAGGCGSKTLIRIGGGNLKSLVVFAFVAIAGYMTLKGLFGVWRVALLDPMAITLSTPQDLPSVLSGAMGMSRNTLLMALMALLGGGLLVFGLMSAHFRKAEPLTGALVVGLIAAAGWYVTGHIGYIAEHPETLQEAFIGTNSGRAESMSFIAPYSYSLELLMFWSDTTKIVTFGIATALGVIAGSAVYAISTGRFRIESFAGASDLGRHMIGAILMGFGGVTAMGCSVGQGVTGLSTLSIGSLITFLAIVAGSALTVKWEYIQAMKD